MSILSPDSRFDIRSDSDWAAYRNKFFPIAGKWKYFDHAAVSPLSLPARQAIERWASEATEEGDTAWPRWAREIERIRRVAARLVNAQESEIGFIPSTSFGISIVAEGLSWNAGDNVVIPAGEFPSNLYPWMNLQSRGVELRIVSTDAEGRFTADQIDQACDARTRLVSTSWVGFGSGFRVDPATIAQIAHRHQAYYFLDAIQGLGVFPLDVQQSGIDFFAADGHKWLMGPEGAGIFFCRQALLDELHPRVIGWNSVQTSHDFSVIDLTYKNSAARFEPGTPNTAGVLGLGGSLDLISAAGTTSRKSPIGQRILELSDYLVQSLDGAGWTCRSPRSGNEEKSGIVAFERPGTEPALARKALLDQGIVTSVRNHLLRFSPHAYNDRSDIDCAADVLSRLNL